MTGDKPQGIVGTRVYQQVSEDELVKSTKSIAKKELDGFVGQGYGIYSGSTIQWAKLKISKKRARWVSRELWHPLLKATEQEDGSLILEVPFTDIRELSMDVFRQGRHVEVLEPKALRAEVISELLSAIKNVWQLVEQIS